MAELAEVNKNYRQLLIKEFFGQVWKVDKNTKFVHFFNNSQGIFFLAENQVQNFSTCRGRHLSALGYNYYKGCMGDNFLLLSCAISSYSDFLFSHLIIDQNLLISDTSQRHI